MSILGVVVHIFVIVIVHDSYFFADYGTPDCSPQTFKVVYKWWSLEIAAFYLTFVSNVLFLFTCQMCLKDSGISYPEKKENRVDFLIRYQTMCGLYQTFF